MLKSYWYNLFLGVLLHISNHDTSLKQFMWNTTAVCTNLPHSYCLALATKNYFTAWKMHQINTQWIIQRPKILPVAETCRVRCVHKLILLYLGAIVGTIIAYMFLVAFVSITLNQRAKQTHLHIQSANWEHVSGSVKHYQN